MRQTLSLLILMHVSMLVSTPSYRYDRTRNENEDNLPKLQPLNYRLPHIPTKPPFFLGPTFLNLSAAPGTTVVLPCRVMHIGSASLSWLRRPQLTVLSSGNTLFSSSPRLRLLHSPGSPDWTLQIGPLVHEDEGTYECQVNTEPKLSRTVQLNVMSGSQLSELERTGPGPALALQGDSSMVRLQKTEILSPDTMRVYEGGTATLECVVTEHEVAPAYFTWSASSRQSA